MQGLFFESDNGVKLVIRALVVLIGYWTAWRAGRAVADGWNNYSLVVVYTFLLGGAVLVESVFSWSGIGAYAVQSVVNRDYAPIQSFVLIAGLFSLVVYLVVDLLYMIADPRIRLGGGTRP